MNLWPLPFWIPLSTKPTPTPLQNHGHMYIWSFDRTLNPEQLTWLKWLEMTEDGWRWLEVAENGDENDDDHDNEDDDDKESNWMVLW